MLRDPTIPCQSRCPLSGLSSEPLAWLGDVMVQHMHLGHRWKLGSPQEVSTNLSDPWCKASVMLRDPTIPCQSRCPPSGLSSEPLARLGDVTVQRMRSDYRWKHCCLQ